MDTKAAFADYALHELGRKESTVSAYVQRLAYWEAWFGKPAEQITSDDVREFLRAKPYRSETMKGMVVAIRQFHFWGALEGHWQRNGISYIKTPRITDSDCTPALTVREVRKVKAACQRPLEYRLVYLGLYAGMRIGETARFSGEMWREDFIYFRGEKNDEFREIPIHPDLDEKKWLILACLPTDASTLQRIKRRLEKRSGVGFVAHQLRKSFSQGLYDAGVPDEVVKDLLGHADSVTGRYRRVSRRQRIEALDRLTY